MRVGSLCSGYEGLGLAVKDVFPDAELAWVSDIDKGACKILAHRFPGVQNLGDFTATKWVPDCPTELGGCGRPAEVLPDKSGWQCHRCGMLWPTSLGKVYWPEVPEPVEIVTAGFPCQPVSHAGKRLGDDDERWLWDDVLRAVRELRPGLLLLENVRGLLTAGSGRLFGRVVGSLAGIGYDAQWVGIRAADVGAPHNRWRIFIAAHPKSGGRRWGTPQLTGLSSDTAGSGTGPSTLLPTPRTSDTNGAGAHGEGGVDLRTAVTLLPTPAVNDMGEGKTVDAWDDWTAKMKAAHGNGNGHGASLAIEAQRLLPTPSVADGMGGHQTRSGARSDEPLLGGVHLLLPTPMVGSSSPAAHGQISGQCRDQMAEALTRWGDYAPAIHRWEQVIGRPAPAPTMTSSKGNPQLAPAFVEWMMGLPDGWVTAVPGLTRNDMLRALGNGVVPQQAAAALRIMLSRMAVAA